MSELSEPDVANDANRFRKLMKEQSDLTPIVEAYREYKKNKQAIEDALVLLDEESDEEMKELAKEELNEAKANVAELEDKLKILLLPKDPNDDKNVIVEIRAGAQAVRAFVPLSKMFGYATDLRSRTQGRGTHVMQFDHYEPLPDSLAKELIKNRGYDNK